MADYIKIGDLREITDDIKNEANNLLDAYSTHVVTALESSQVELKVSGLNYDEVQESMKKVFTNIVGQINELTDAMNTKILPKYEATAASVSKLFNQDFANQITEYLNVINND
jgi:DNA anti-recombination protein RmuC